MRVLLKRLLTVVGLVSVVFALMWAAFSLARAGDRGENVASVSWLPATASNVSYYRSYLFTVYEFDISEVEFVRWSKWPVSEISEPIEVTRYNCFDTPDFGPNPNPAQRRVINEAIDQSSAKVANGLYYLDIADDGGGIHLAFDRDKGRAYFMRSPH